MTITGFAQHRHPLFWLFYKSPCSSRIVPVETFHAEMRRRLLVALSVQAVCSFLIFLISAPLMMISIFQPIVAVKAVNGYFSLPPILFVLAISDTLISTILSALLSAFLFDLNRLNGRNISAWIFPIIFAWLQSISGYLFLLAAKSQLVKGEITSVPSWFIHVAIIISAMAFVRREKFQLHFSTLPLPATSWNKWFHWCQDEPILKKAFEVCLPVAKYTTIVLLCMVFPWHSEPLLGFLAAMLQTVWPCFIIVLRGNLVYRISIVISRAFLMQPISFPFLPAYRPVGEPPSKIIYVTDAIAVDCNCILLKAFAFHDLRRVAITDRKRRQDAFTLSQPGGHPRNWTAVLNGCIAIMKSLSERMTKESHRPSTMANSSIVSTMGDQQKNGILGRKSLFIPPHLQEGPLSDGLPRRRLPGTNEIVAELKKEWNARMIILSTLQRFIPDIPMISDIEITLALEASEALAMFIYHSYEEDQYGVVQGQLKTAIGALLDLVVAVDRFIRLKQLRVSSGFSGPPIVALEQSLHNSLNMVMSKFAGHISSIGLTSDQEQLLISLTKPSS